MGFLAAASGASGDRKTLMAVASVQGQAFLRTDARVFNVSYTDTVTVTADFFCASASCGGEQRFDLAPRESRALDDLASFFGVTDTQGAVVFTAPEDIVVTSRLSSENANGRLGQFVPGLDAEEAHPTQVLTSLQNSADPKTGFRANVVAFNPSDTESVALTFHLFLGDGSPLGEFAAPALAPRAFLPAFSIFAAVGASGISTDNAYCVVTGDGVHPFFVVAAVLDNRSQDTIFVKGEADADFEGPILNAGRVGDGVFRSPAAAPPPLPGGHRVIPVDPAPPTKVKGAESPVASFTVSGSPMAGSPVQFTDTSTGGPTSWSWNFGDPGSGADNISSLQNPSHTYAAGGDYVVTLVATNGTGPSFPRGEHLTIGSNVQTITLVLQSFEFNGGQPFVLHVGISYSIVLHALDGGDEGHGHGFSGVSALGLPSVGNIKPGSDVTMPTITPTAGQVGTYSIHCSTLCGTGHLGMTGAIEVVSP